MYMGKSKQILNYEMMMIKIICRVKRKHDEIEIV